MHEELTASFANLVSTTLSCDLGPDLLHEALALGPTEGLEGGQLRHPISMDPDQVHDICDFEPREYAAACCIPFLSGHVVDLFLKAVRKLLDHPLALSCRITHVGVGEDAFNMQKADTSLAAKLTAANCD